MSTFAISFLAAGLAAAPAPAITAADAWCRATPPAAPAAGCYVTLTARADDRLVGADTAAADHGEIHTMDMTGGVMRMRRLPDGLALPAGRPVALKPGSFHLMIIGPKRQLKAGDVLPLTLRFAKAGALNLKVTVRDATAGAKGGHQ